MTKKKTGRKAEDLRIPTMPHRLAKSVVQGGLDGGRSDRNDSDYLGCD